MTTRDRSLPNLRKNFDGDWLPIPSITINSTQDSLVNDCNRINQSDKSLRYYTTPQSFPRGQPC